MVKKNITSTDVAKLAGVSQSTVSRVFGNGASVSPKKRQKILDAATKLGYQPNALARGLITRKTKIIGIVMHNVRNPFYPEVLEKFYNRLSEQGYHIIFINSKNEQIQESEISHLIEYNVEGVVITDATLSSSTVQRFLKNDIKVILFNRYTNPIDCSSVFCDNYDAGKEIGNFLVDNGHKNFAFISGPLNTSTTLDRKKGFTEALEQHGIKNIAIEIGNYTYESGFSATLSLLQNNKYIDCIFCSNDITALGAIDAIRKQGLHVPDDISIIGFDNISMASWPAYDLTTWQQPVDEMIEKTIQLLIHEESVAISPFSIKGHLVVRGSVKNGKNFG